MNGPRKIAGLIQLVALLGLLAACMPKTEAPRSAFTADEQNPGTTSGSDGGSSSEVLASFNGEARNFLDKGSTRSFDVQTVAINTADSLVVWGENVQTAISSLSASTKVCLLAEYKNTTPSRVLVLSAVRRRLILNTQTTTSGVVSTVAYSWLVFPGDAQRNQTDCLTTGIINTKNQLFGGTAALKFSLSELCNDCTSSPQSEGLRAHFDSGSALNDVNISALKLKIQLDASSSGSGQTCSSNSVCAQIGLNCCLDGQCVKDGAVKAGVDTSLGAFQSAWTDVQNNPSRFTIYPQFFYVCPTTVPTVPGDDDATDPNFAAQKRFNEMRDLHECLNPQFDEIGYCPVKFANASVRINSTNPTDKNFTVNKDDNNFHWANTLLNPNSIYSFRYGEQLLYQEGLTGFDSTNLAGSHSFPGVGNSNLTAAQTVTITKALPTNAPDDTLIIKYKVDATCEKLSSMLARCSKTYVQGRQSSVARPADHASSNYFALPVYSDLTSFVPIVKIGDTVVAASDSTWRVSGKGVLFTTPVTTGQTVKITYYVTPSTANLDDLTAGRTAALTRVNELCGCGVIGTTNCNLSPVTQTTAGVTTVTDYRCVYPAPVTPEPPLQQVVYVSGKTVPSRYFDINGAVWDNDSGASAPAQEGVEFKYTNGDRLKPNNLTSYVGFHEIYGSFDKSGGAAKPPRMVSVKKGTNYDIFVDSGGFASCENCGNDPYSPILKLFPSTFANKGGGFVPDVYTSTRLNNTGTYRADDLIYGRACFVPATMLPWTHAADSTDISRQRQRRLAAQHLMFANGYQRDWYGFDYGSLIGSFDGVTWFSVGNQRRIKATGSRLLLAVNAYYGDQTVDNNFKVVVSETVAAVNSGSNVNHDTMSDGAQCQKNHFCSTDSDCVSQLGYDYTCQNVTTVSTNWPVFDASGNEMLGAESRSLISLVGGANGQARRCVYRGRGAPCDENLNALTASYNGTELVGFSACSPNHYCAKVDGSARFNTSIARFASSPTSQNLLGGLGTRDTMGLGARYIGRPLDYYGTKTPATISTAAWGLSTTTTLASHMKTNLNVDGLCLPGRDVTGSTTFADAHARVPSVSDKEAADRMFGVGATAKVNASTPTSSKFLGMCPAVVDGVFAHHRPTTSLTDPAVMTASVRQNLATSLLDMSEYTSLGLFNTNAGSVATAVGYQRNACLRAPGASCLSDMECAPSSFVATKMKSLASWGGFANNPAEQAFWKEELVCGNPEPSQLFDNTFNSSYDLKQNRCCREIGKTLTTLTQFDANTNFLNCSGTAPAIPGVTVPINSAQRNIRNSVVYDVASCNPPEAGKTPALIAPSPRSGASALMSINSINQQYDTLDAMNQRMCCTSHWVRSFASENGGGHQWGQGRIQNVDKTIFGAWNWYFDRKFSNVLDETENMACSAENFGTLACEIRSLNETQSTTYLNWISLFELVGIPQVMITMPTSANGLERLVEDAGNAQTTLEGANSPLRKTITTAQADVTDGTNTYVSAASYNKMDVGSGKMMKKVFSESEFNCCVPAGGNVPKNANANMCCTGTLTDEAEGAEGEARCCLDDFSDVTVYLNRYVSSEGRGLPANMYDPKTGYIKDPAQVFAIAQAKKLCCSGNIVPGRAVSELYTPLQGGNVLPQGKARRFVYRNDAVDNNDETGAVADVYDAGLRWNTHYYCAPADYEAP